MVGKKIHFMHYLALIEANSLLRQGLAQQLIAESRKQLPSHSFII